MLFRSLLEEEDEECPMCGEFAKEIDDDETMEKIDTEREERKREVIPFSLGEENERS